MWWMAVEEEFSRRSKRSKQSASFSVDGLSELPDDLLLLVLSYLPAKEAIRAGSLSRRWRYLPSLLPIQPHLLVGTPITSLYPTLPPQFPLDLEAIDRALSSQTSLLRSCEIVPDAAPDPQTVQRWANALARRGIRELLLDFRRIPAPDASSVVHLCRSLLKLELRCCCLFQNTLSIRFLPLMAVGCVLLTHLRLVEVKISDDTLLGIASSCQMLTNLDLIGCFGFKWLRLEDAQRLKVLSYHCPVDTLRDELRNIEIDAPNLEVLDLRALAPQNGLNIVAPKLRSVHLSLARIRRRFFAAVAPGLRKLLRGAPDINCLQLRGGAVDCLSVDRLPDSFDSPYLYLRRLYINLVIKNGPQALCLAVLLQQFSTLEQLNLFIIKGEVHNVGAIPPVAVFDDHEWRLEQSACISNHLQFVTISGFTGEVYEMNLSGFILTRARALKKMTISLNKRCSNAGKNMAESLASLVTASPKVKLLVKKSR